MRCLRCVQPAVGGGLVSTPVVQTSGVLRAADVRALLGDPPPYHPEFLIEEADDAARQAYHRLRHQAFVDRQGLFDRTDLDDRDEDPRTIILVARDLAGTILGGVRLGPATAGPDIGWWQGGRLVTAVASEDLPRHTSDANGCDRPGRVRGRPVGIGAALVRAACARAEAAGALRFDATVQTSTRRFFERLGWRTIRPVEVAGSKHFLMRWPIDRVTALVAGTKSELGPLLRGIGPPGFVGDDGAPVPGSDVVAACDAIVPAMVERDPEWAGWCSDRKSVV